MFLRVSINRRSVRRTRIVPPALRAVTAVAAPLAKRAVPTIPPFPLKGRAKIAKSAKKNGDTLVSELRGKNLERLTL
jgi:hypothetical protein